MRSAASRAEVTEMELGTVAQHGAAYATSGSEQSATHYLDSLRDVLRRSVGVGCLFDKCCKLLRRGVPGPPCLLAKEGALLSETETHQEWRRVVVSQTE